MLALGFLAAASYWPGWYNPAMAPRWIAVAMVVPVLLMQAGPIEWTGAHVVGCLFIAWAVLSLFWSAAPLDSLNALIQLGLLAGAFCLGSQAKTLRPLYVGAAAGMAVSSALAVAQGFGWAILPYRGHVTSGLFVNGNYMAEGAALILVAAVSARMWWALPAVLPALVLPEARGAILGATAGLGALLWRRSRPLTWALLVAAVGLILYVGSFKGASVAERLDLWSRVDLSWFGQGIGAFWASGPIIPDGLAEHAHNDFLEILVELGPIGLALAVWFCASLTGAITTERGVLVALAVEACFAFPTHLPLTGLLGAVVAGRAAGDGSILRHSYRDGRRILSEGLA